MGKNLFPVYSYATNLYRVDPSIKANQLVKLVDQKFGPKSLAERTAHTWVKQFREGVFDVYQEISEVTESFDQEYVSKFDVDQETGYTFKTKKGPFTVSIEKADEIFYQYSEHGLNMTGTQIINKHGFEVWQWLSLKNSIGLYKKSNIFSPWTVEHTPKDQLEQKIQEKLNYALSDKLNIENQYQKAVHKKWKKDITAEETRALAFQTLASQVAPLIKKAEISKAIPVAKVKGNKKIVAYTGDWHIGAKVEGLVTTPDFNPAILKGYLKQIAEVINRQGASYVKLGVAGDIIESFTGKNHKNQFMSLEQGYYGANVVIKAYEIMTWFISLINNVKEIDGIGGNHDRWSESNDLDTRGEIAKLLFYFLQKSHGDHIKINYGDNVLSSDFDGIRYIMVHGDKKKDNAKSEKLIFDYGDTDKYNMIIGAHKHTREIKGDHRRFRKITIPSLFTGNEYSDDLGFATLPGVTIIENNGSGHPIVHDYPLEV